MTPQETILRAETRAEAFEEAAAWCEGDHKESAAHHFRRKAAAERAKIARLLVRESEK